MNKLPYLGVFGLIALSAACGPGGAPGAGGSRESGQSKLMGETFAGKNACNPENHERPFIIEWDATDMSQFESIASNDVVFVKYEGCKLTVLDSCKDDSVRGSFGSYKPVEWTSGSLEKMEIKSEAELYANLPLGVASLGGRVSGGEQFRMEYYVAGTRSATRPAAYAGDVSKVPGCKGATHFVYGFNLGAFALGSAKDTSVSAEGSLYGFGAGGSSKKSSKADKQGGDLTTCKSDTATEIQGCKVPIRLTLRKIESGENPDVTARKAPETDASLNKASKLEAKFEATGEAGEHFKSAQTKFAAKDGKGCLAELDAHDKLNPKDKSTEPKSGFPHYLRAQCVMVSGKCDVGKAMATKGLAVMQGDQSPGQIDGHVEALAKLYCQGKMGDRDTLLQAVNNLIMAGVNKKDAAYCKSNYDTAKRLFKTVKPKDEDDTQIVHGPRTLYDSAARCAVKAGDCDLAWKLYKDGYPVELLKNTKADLKEQIMRSGFETSNQKCKKK
ncbi:MAG: hypothetical protein IPI67_06915 [Myxococcales bacterium]|nr:hypothetical protein [Myxococcales bacterium]